MKLIILAAGEGKRLRPHTNDRPKCMVLLKNKPLLHHQISSITKCGIEMKDIALACGYLHEAIEDLGLKRYLNDQYSSTNMVSTLFSAIDFMKDNEDLVISYGDIVYSPSVLKKLITSSGDIAVSSDLDWLSLWSQRMESPLDDAETFKVKGSSKLVEIGKKPKDLNDIYALYIGLIKIPASKVRDFKNHYLQMDRTKFFDGNNFDNLYMTSLIQDLIDNNWDVQASYVHGGWIEVDTIEDLQAYENQKKLPFV